MRRAERRRGGRDALRSRHSWSAGREKRAERDAKLGGKKARKAAKAAENARIAQLPLVRRYSELKKLAIAGLQALLGRC